MWADDPLYPNSEALTHAAQRCAGMIGRKCESNQMLRLASKHAATPHMGREQRELVLVPSSGAAIILFGG
jgi:hypothetical protein